MVAGEISSPRLRSSEAISACDHCDSMSGGTEVAIAMTAAADRALRWVPFLLRDGGADYKSRSSQPHGPLGLPSGSRPKRN